MRLNRVDWLRLGDWPYVVDVVVPIKRMDALALALPAAAPLAREHYQCTCIPRLSALQCERLPLPGQWCTQATYNKL